MTILDLIEDAYDPLGPVRAMARDEQEILGRLRGQLKRKQRALRTKERYYESRQLTRYMDVSVPPMFRAVGVALGWAGTVVDTYDSRTRFRGWRSAGDLMGLDEIYEDNFLGVESSRASLDTRIFGQGFIAVSKGDPDNGEPEILVTGESSLRTTMLWNYRTRRADAAYSQTYDNYNRIVLETLYLPDSTITLERDPDSTAMVVTDVDDHGFGRVPVVRLTNRDRASNPHGRSDITPPIRYATDAAVRTALGLEIHREFYNTPATFALNVRPEMFGITDSSKMTAEQKARVGWSIMMGNINLVPPNTDPGAAPPDIKQLPVSSPQPYLDQLAGYGNMVSSASGLPRSYLGFVGDMAPNADSIRAEEYPMVRHIERSIESFAHSMRNLAWLCLLWRDEEAPDTDAMRQIRSNYADPSVPQRSANADEVQKLIAGQVLAPNGQVTYERINLSDAEMEQNDLDMKKWRDQQLEQAKKMQELQPKPAPGPANPGPVKANGNEGTPATAKDPANVARGQQIARQAGQGGS